MDDLMAFSRKYWVYLAIFLLSLAMKLMLLSAASVVNRDAMVYIAAAQKFSCGMFAEGIQHYPMPLYPLLLAALHLVVPDWILAGRLLSLIPLLLCLVPVYFLTLRLFDQDSARAAILLFAVLPVFNTPVTGVVRDPLFLLCALGTLAAVAQYNYRSTFKALAGAVILAVLATLMRIEGVLLLALVPALYVWEKRKNFSARYLFQALGALLGALLILALTVWGFSIFGIASQSRLPEAFEWFKGLITLDILSNYHALMAELKQFQQQLPAADLRNNILESARHYAPIIYALGLTEILIKEVFPTSLLALWGLRFYSEGEQNISALSPSRAIIVWPWIMFVALNLLFCMVHNFTTTRYMRVPIALSLPFVARGISLWWRKLQPRKGLAWILMGVFFITPALKTMGYASKKTEDHCIRVAGEWVQQHDPHKQLRLLFSDRRLMVYADRVDAYYSADHADCFAPQSDCIQTIDMALILRKQTQKLEYPVGFAELARFESGDEVVVVWGKLGTDTSVPTMEEAHRDAPAGNE
ncbi:MAG: glycosyltransferase family 39 protein [Desulfuromonadaceae bacterium]|nr:glycosyltransferase family 39 protein [Desulfuromonadaceae bacterium]